MTKPQLERARRLLCALQDHIRDTLVAARSRSGRRFARIAGVTAADTIYHVDRLSERAILGWFARHWPKAWPVELVMEGIADGAVVTFPHGTDVARTKFKCILDPIDGTRGLMYDKRAAWSLAALAPQRGSRTHLGDIVVAAMTELPTSKQGFAEQFSAVRGQGRRGLVAHVVDLRRGTRRRARVQPSRATHFRHGFASFVKFFPEGRALTAQLEEELWRELHGRGAQSRQVVFDDQYISTGGQLAELLVGHDRMIGDLRPLVLAKLRLRTALTCHPYDICTALILTEAGGIVETPDGRPLRAPLDTTSPVAWIGYANAKLARTVRPVLRRLLKRRLR
jgi:fructose-1,6-bisphosphatase/inositol monophosphatase family enzyme